MFSCQCAQRLEFDEQATFDQEIRIIDTYICVLVSDTQLTLTFE